MKKKLFSLLAVMALCIGLIPLMALPVHAAEETSVTVGDTSDYYYYVPSYSSYKYAKSQYIIKASELVDIKDKTITELKWYLYENRIARDVKVILSEVEYDSLSGLVDVSGEPVAYGGNQLWTVGSGNVVSLVFNIPYEYKGGNLLITVLDNTGESGSTNYFYSNYDSSNSYVYYTYGSSRFDASYTGGSYTYYRPMTTLVCGDASNPPAVPVKKYNLWIAGTQVDDTNVDDLTAIPGVDGTAASYDPDTKTLYLEDVTISGGVYSDSTIYSTIDDLIFDIRGNCTIRGTDTFAIYVNQDIVVKGNGVLNVYGVDYPQFDSSSYAIKCWYIYAYEDVTINASGGNGSYSYGLFCNSVRTYGNGKVDARGGSSSRTSYGIYVDSPMNSISASENSIIFAEGGDGNYSYGAYILKGYLYIYDDASITLKGGTGSTAYGLAFAHQNADNTYYAQMGINNQNLTISGQTAAINVTSSVNPVIRLQDATNEDQADSSVPAAFVSDNVDGTDLQVYNRTLKNANDQLYKYFTTKQPSGFEDYSLWVGTVRVNSMNASDILGDGTASFDSSTNTLYLDNANVKGEDSSSKMYLKAICYVGTEPLTVSASGTTSVTSGTSNISYGTGTAFDYNPAGIYSLGPLTLNVQNGATLTVNGGGSYSGANYGIWAKDSLTISGDGTVDIQSGEVNSGGWASPYGASFAGDMTLDGTVDVNFTALPSNGSSGIAFGANKSWSIIAPDWTGTLVAKGKGTGIRTSNGNYLSCEDAEITVFEEVDSTEGTLQTETEIPIDSLSGKYKKLVIVPYQVPASYTATLDPKGGTVDPTEITVSYQGTYDLPTPVKDGYIFDGWYAKDYQSEKYVSQFSNYSGSQYTIRISPFDSPTYDQIKTGSIVVFDVLVNGTVPESVEVNDLTLDPSYYQIDGNRVSGRFEMTSNMQYNYFGFLDINLKRDTQASGYTVIKFMVLNRSDSKYFDGDTVTNKRPHTLYAGWNNPILYDLWVGNTRVSSINAADVLGDGTVVYDEENNTLILDGADIVSDGTVKTAAIECYMPKLIIDVRGTNTLKGAESDRSYGIYSSNSLEIKGSGTLEANAPGTRVSYGVRVGGKLTIGDEFTGTLTAIGSDVASTSGSSSYGIYCNSYDGITLSGSGKVIAKAGDVQDGQSYGIYSGRIMLSGTVSVEAESGNGVDNGNYIGVESNGVLCYGEVIIADKASLSVSSGTVKGSYSMGLQASVITVSGGSLRAVTAGGNDCEYSHAISTSTGSGYGLYVTGGTVYAEAGPSKTIGIGFVGGYLDIVGGSFEAKTYSENGYAIAPYASYYVTVSPVVASTDPEGKDPVAYVADDNDSYKWYKAPLTTYDVVITPGEGMTKTSDSGAASQTGLSSAMTDVVYTADDGYYFPKDYASIGAADGIEVSRTDYTKIKISGTPEADVDITLQAASKKEALDASGTGFAATGYDSGKITGLEVNKLYSISYTDSSGTAKDDTVSSDSAELVISIAPGDVVIVRKTTSDAEFYTMTDSDPKTISVTRSAVPYLAESQPASIGGKGSIPTTSVHEFSTDGSSWTLCTGAQEDLDPGIYYVRVATSGTALASEAQEIEIEEFDPSKEVKPSATFVADGPDSGTISGLIDGAVYEFSGAVEGSYTVSGDTIVLPGGISAGTLSIVKKGDGVVTADSDPQEIAIIKPDAPSELAAVNTPTGESIGKIKNTDSSMEFRTEGETDWRSVFGSEITGLSVGVYELRYKAAGTALASEISTVEIVEDNKVADPILPEKTSFTDSMIITIICDTEGADIYYTTDESDPSVSTEAATVYSGEFEIRETTTVKAFAVKAGLEDSNVVSATYTYKAPAPASSYDDSEPTYKTNASEAENGKIVMKPKYAEEGELVTVTVTPDNGYELDTLTVKDKSGNEITLTKNADGTYSFKMPASEITAEAEFKQIEDAFENPFEDVKEGDYFYDAVMWAVKNGITEGTSPTRFSPNGTATRAQTVTFLWRAAGCPKPTITECPFNDINVDAYYYEAVLWAYETGVTDGTSSVHFDPEGTVTRAQTVTFLYRFIKLMGDGFEGTWQFELDYSDVDEVPKYAIESFCYTTMEGIVEGDNGALEPLEDCLRAQIVTMLYRYFVKQ